MDLKEWLFVVFISFVLFKVIKHRKFLYIIFVTLPRDLNSIYLYLHINIFTTYCKIKNKNIAEHFDSQVKKRKNKPCFYFEDEIWTYEMVQKESFKIANYFQALGYKKGDSVGLFMESCPQYICMWLGLSRIGVISSLLNSNIRLKSLERCVKVAYCKAVIFGTELTHAIEEVADGDEFQNIDLFSFVSISEKKDTKNINFKHVNLSDELKYVDARQTVSKEPLNVTDTVLHVYTSGTTGLPKAAIVKHAIVFRYSMVIVGARLKSGKDIIITPIPLYHGMGGISGVGAALFHGIPQVIVRKFSASKHWELCIKHNATVTQYSGEIVRYLCNQPEKPEDKLHKVRIFMGSGVNPSVWAIFVKRFKNITIKDVYAATEGNIGLMNFCGHVGSCGYLPVWAYPVLPYFLARVDETTGEILRDKKTGLAIHAKQGEPGEIMARISNVTPMRQFDGYIDKKATEKKMARDIKQKGDEWFRSGDLLAMDEYGYFHFKDRCGDTFRWKSENVSTAEVEQVLLTASEMKACVVFGVEIPGTEGRCGMACIADPERNLNFNVLTTEINQSLPSYARPLFIRVINREMDMTGTFKLLKVKLQKEGFDITQIRDPVYFYTGANYVLLNEVLYKNVITGKVRF